MWLLNIKGYPEKVPLFLKTSSTLPYLLGQNPTLFQRPFVCLFVCFFVCFFLTSMHTKGSAEWYPEITVYQAESQHDERFSVLHMKNWVWLKMCILFYHYYIILEKDPETVWGSVKCSAQIIIAEYQSFLSKYILGTESSWNKWFTVFERGLTCDYTKCQVNKLFERVKHLHDTLQSSVL